MNLVRLGPLKSELTVFTDKNGRMCLLAVAKGTFSVQPDGTCMLAEEQQELVYADEFYGEPGISSVQYESDFAFYKPRTDVIVVGHAYATGGGPTRRVDVTLELSTIRKTVR